MQKTGLYCQEDVDIMKNHLNVISKVSDIWSAGKLYNNSPLAVSIIIVPVSGDPTLPVGWKIKKYKSKSDTTRVHCEYLSPQNQVIYPAIKVPMLYLSPPPGVPLQEGRGGAHEEARRLQRGRHQDRGGRQREEQGEDIPGQQRSLRRDQPQLGQQRQPPRLLEAERGGRGRPEEDGLPLTGGQDILEQSPGPGGSRQDWSQPRRHQ